MKDEMIKLIDRITEIVSLPLSKVEEEHEIVIDKLGIIHKSETYHKGNTYKQYIYISWEEIEKPNEYFIERFKKEHEEEIKRKEIMKNFKL